MKVRTLEHVGSRVRRGVINRAKEPAESVLYSTRNYGITREYQNVKPDPFTQKSTADLTLSVLYFIF